MVVIRRVWEANRFKIVIIVNIFIFIKIVLRYSEDRVSGGEC